MTGKIIAAAAAAILIAATGVASAKPKTAVQVVPQTRAVYADSYYNKSYWDSVAPHGRSDWQRDPYVGTVYEGVAPY